MPNLKKKNKQTLEYLDYIALNIQMLVKVQILMCIYVSFVVLSERI